MKSFSLWAVFAIVTFIFNTCSTTNSNQKSASLTDTTWDIEGGGTLNFTEDSYSMNLGCNTMNGTYKVTGSSIEFQPGMTTLIGCPEDVLKRETEMSNKISKMKSFKKEGDKIILSGDNGEKIKLMTPSNEEITGKWKLQSILVDFGDGMAGVTSSIEFEKSFIEIQKDGAYTGRAVCNNFHGKSKLDTSSNSIKFGMMAMTKMYCGDKDKQNMENNFIKAMEKVTSYSIDRNKLDLKDAEGKIQVTFVK